VMQRVTPEERPGYGTVLLKLLDGFSVGSRVFSSAVPVVSSKHEIKRRILMIKHHRSGSIAACVGTALVVLALGCATFTHARGPKERGASNEKPTALARDADQQKAAALANNGTEAIGEPVVDESTPNPRESRESAARGFYERAMKHYIAAGQLQDSAARAKEYEAQLADLNKALELNPDHAEALFSRGCLYGGDLPMDKRDDAKAVADYSRLLEIEPRNVSARHNRAGCYEQLREPNKALADYTRIINGDADFSRLLDGKDKQVALDYHYRGRVYFDQKDYARAVADFNEALRLDPEIAKPEASGRIILRRGQAYHALKEYSKAQDDFARYREIDPEFFQLWQSWAWQLATCPDARFRDGRKALEYANKVASATTGPRHRGVADGETRAAAYAELGLFEEAVQWQKKALDALAPDSEEKRKIMGTRLELYESKRPFRD